MPSEVQGACLHNLECRADALAESSGDAVVGELAEIVRDLIALIRGGKFYGE